MIKLLLVRVLGLLKISSDETWYMKFLPEKRRILLITNCNRLLSWVNSEMLKSLLCILKGTTANIPVFSLSGDDEDRSMHVNHRTLCICIL